MKRIQKSAVLVICLGVFFVLTACTTPAGRTAGEVVDDAAITTKVKAKLLDESILRGFAISVATFEGIVTLTGAVDTENERTRAGQIAGSTSGVRKVNNLIQLKK